MIGTCKSPFTLARAAEGLVCSSVFRFGWKSWRRDQGSSHPARPKASSRLVSVQKDRKQNEGQRKQNEKTFLTLRVRKTTQMTKIGRHGAQRSTITSVYIDFCQMNVIGGVELFVCFSEQNNSIFLLYLICIWCLGIVLLVLVSAKESVTIASTHFCGSEIEQSMNQHIIHFRCSIGAFEEIFKRMTHWFSHKDLLLNESVFWSNRFPKYFFDFLIYACFVPDWINVWIF